MLMYPDKVLKRRFSMKKFVVVMLSLMLMFSFASIGCVKKEDVSKPAETEAPESTPEKAEEAPAPEPEKTEAPAPEKKTSKERPAPEKKTAVEETEAPEKKSAGGY